MTVPHAALRCFVALPITEDLRAALRGYVHVLRRSPVMHDGWTWTDADGWHVTLAFLGATDPRRIAELSGSLERVAGTEQTFELESSTSGAFPSPRRARVLWYGFADPEGRLGRLAGRVRQAVGLAPEERFSPHLTLARARDRSGTDVSTVMSSAGPPAATMPVDRIILYRSHLGRGPARYEALVTAALARAA